MFLGLGGFHFEKIVLGCVRSYLKPSGISSVLVATECFGEATVDSVINGTNYIRSKEGIARIHESIYLLMLEQFIQDTNYEMDINKIETIINNDFKFWNADINDFDSFSKDFFEYLKKRSNDSLNFNSWYIFVFRIYPIIRDLT